MLRAHVRTRGSLLMSCSLNYKAGVQPSITVKTPPCSPCKPVNAAEYLTLMTTSCRKFYNTYTR